MNDVHSYDLDTVRRIARQLETAMDGFRMSEPAELAAAMASYCDLVQYCNQRLLEAHNRLREGNRSHAIEAIEAEPNVLDCLQELDAVDARIPEWSDTWDLYDIKRPERILTELADELGQQYDAKHHLAEELRAHRLLAIGIGPIEQRVAILRRMVQLDPDNKFWRQDLVEYERHCQSKLRTELQSLDRSLGRDVPPNVAARIKFIAEKLADVSWQEAVDAAIVRESQAVQAKARKLFVRSELANVIKLIRVCQDNGDDDRAMVHFSHWQRLSDELALPPTDPLVCDNEDVLVWAEQMAERAAVRAALVGEISTLSALISKPIPVTPGPAGRVRDALRMAQQRVYVRAQGGEKSAELAQWMEASSHRLADIERRIRVARWLIGAAIVTSVAVLATGAGLAWRSVSMTAARNALIAEIKSLRGDKKHRDVAAITDKAGPAFKNDATVRKAVGEVDRELERSQDAREAIDRVVESVTKLLSAADDSVKALATHTSLDSEAIAVGKTVSSDLAAVDTGLFRLRNAVKDARQEVFLHDDGIDEKIDDFNTQATRQRGEHRRWVGMLRDAEYSRLSGRLREIGTEGDENVEDVALQQVETEIRSLESFSGRNESGLRDLVIKARGKSSENASLAAVRRNLDQASSNGPEAVLDLLMKSAERLDGKRSDQAEVVAASRKEVAAAVGWASVARKWRSKVFGSKDELKEWGASLRAVETLPPAWEGDAIEKQRLDELNECLRQMTVDADEVTEELQPLEEYLASRIFGKEVLEVEIEGHPYYFLMQGTAEKPQCFINEDETDDGASRVNREIEKAVGEKQGRRARHLELAGVLRDKIESMKEGKICFEDGLIAMIDDLLGPKFAGLGTVDELLRARLLIDVINLAMSRQLFQDNKPLEKLQEDLASKVGEGMAWVVRRDLLKRKINDAESRLAATKIFEQGSQRMKTIRDAMNRRLEYLGARPSFCKPLEYVGWADDSDGSTVKLSGTPKAIQLNGVSGTVFAVITTTGDPVAWKLVECGQVRNGTVILRNADPAMFGRPVFLEITLSSTARKPAGS